MKKLLCLLFLISSLVLPVAAKSVPDLSQYGSISVLLQYDGKPVSGGELTLYRVGDILEADGNYRFIFAEDFVPSGAVHDLQSPETIKELSDYVLRKGISGETKKTDTDGKVSFLKLQPALYLLVQHKSATGYHRINPFLVSLPMYSAEGYSYEVDASPKVSPMVALPENLEQPQTGQSGWPIWVFTCASGGLVILTLIKKCIGDD